MNPKKLISVLTISILFLTFGLNVSFAEDSPMSAVAVVNNLISGQNSEAVDYLYEQGIVQGYDDGLFHPEYIINRAEFLKIVMEASDYEIEGSNCYKDVHDEWFAKYVCAATDLGLADGYSDGYFRPEKEINFAEASKMISNVLELEQEETNNEEWYQRYVISLQEKNSIPTSIEAFNQKINRGEMAEIIWRLLSNTTKWMSATYESIELVENYDPEAEYQIYDPDSDLFSQYIGAVNIPLGPEAIIENADGETDEQTSKEIAFLAALKNQFFYFSASMYLEVHKDIVYYLYPKTGRYLILDTLDPETAVFVEGESDVADAKNIILIKDKNAVYQLVDDPISPKIKTIADLDLNTFVQLDYYPTSYDCEEPSVCQDYGVYKDKNNAYHMLEDGELLILLNVEDVETFEAWQSDLDLFYQDKYRAYYYNSSKKQIFPLSGSDSMTFERVPDSMFYKDKYFVYYHNFDSGIVSELIGADSESFEIAEVFGGEIIRDKYSLFEYNQQSGTYRTIPNFELQAAEQMSLDFPEDTNIFKYNEKVYSYDLLNHNLVEIENADYDSLKISFDDEWGFVEDKNAIYLLPPNRMVLVRVDGVDKDTVELLGRGYDSGTIIVKDRDNVYYTDIDSDVIFTLEDADPTSFEVLTMDYGIYAKDKNHVYSKGENAEFAVVEGLDAKTFEVRQGNDILYGKDENGFYYLDDMNDILESFYS